MCYRAGMDYFSSAAFGRIMGVVILLIAGHGMRIMAEQKHRHIVENIEAYAARELARKLKVLRYQAWRNDKLRLVWYWLTRPISRIRPRQTVDLITTDSGKRPWDVVYRRGSVTVERRVD